MNQVSRLRAYVKASVKPAAAVVVACAGFASLAQPTAVAADRTDKTNKTDKQVDFAKDIQPIFKTSCIRCHSNDPNNARKRAAGGFRLDDKAAAFKGGKAGKDIVPGSAKDSLIYGLLLGPVKHGDDEVAPMPKPKRGEAFKPLPQDQIDTIKLWLDQGAKWPG